MSPISSQDAADELSSLPMVGRYGYGEGGDVALEGTVETLREFASRLAADEPSTICTLPIPREASPAPYDAFLKAIYIRRGEGDVQIKLEESTLVIAGSSEKIGMLAENISSLADEPDPATGVQHHMHIEYYPDHFYLAPSALPLVVSVEEGTGETMSQA